MYSSILDTSPKKCKCPNCGRITFTHYIFSDTKKIISEKVGRCDRENNCSYHYTPKQFFSDNKVSGVECFHLNECRNGGNGNRNHSASIEYLPAEVVEKSVSLFQGCDLYPFLQKLFCTDIADYLCTTYKIGKSKNGNTVFWQADMYGNVRQAKLIRYDTDTGKRSKDHSPHFLGKKIIGNSNAVFQQCFFGEHLLALPENKGRYVAIVESEKTAVIASVFFPQYVWLATGGKHGAKWTSPDVSKVLEKRTVILFPDLGAFDSWTEKANSIKSIVKSRVIVSETLEKLSNDFEKKEGLDLADFLLKDSGSTGLALTSSGYPVMWDFYPVIAKNLFKPQIEI